MKLTPESSKINDYLEELDVVDYSHPLISKKALELFDEQQSEIEKVKIAFEYVRDQIAHSWDIQSSRITCKASEVLNYKEGICYAKVNLLAAFLRSKGIPTGFCYQRLLLFDPPETEYCIHALNAVYLKSINKWIRIDARGNKPGIQAEFSLNEEKIAFQVQEQFNEKDYPIIYTKPNSKTIKTLQTNTNALEMYKYKLPDEL